MKKRFIILTALFLGVMPMWAQGVLDALPALTQQPQGTARYTAMGGAFGALGGDLTTIRQNPAGIGVYRSSELSVTAGLNFYNNTVTSPSRVNKENGFYFTGDNLGIVGVIRWNDGVLRNLNFGFAYNNIANFNNVYRADWNNIGTSVTNIIADNTCMYNVFPDELALADGYNPYQYGLPWMSVLAYNTYLINPTDANSDYYSGIFKEGTSGRAYLHTATSGAVDEYDFNISGNISDKFYWGLSVNVTNILYNIDSYYGESLKNAQVAATANGVLSTTDGEFDIHNRLTTRGIGAGVKVGIIYRPFNFLRLGAAFHSPTYYDMSDTYSAAVEYDFNNIDGNREHGSMDDINNQTDLGSFKYHLSTPWHFMASAATVLGKWGIISVDYEYTDAQGTRYSGSDADYESSSNKYITEQMQGVHNVRVGAEFRATPAFSIRAGYAYESSPMRKEYFNGTAIPQVVDGTLTQYQIPGDAHNISCGLGYRFNNFSVDVAYVHRMQDYSIYPFTTNNNSYCPTIMGMHHNSVKLSFGYRF